MNKLFKKISLIKKSFKVILLVLVSISTAKAQIEVSVPFNDGFIGLRGNNAQDATNIQRFSTLTIAKAFFVQTTNSGRFEAQGNDITGILRLQLNNGAKVDIPGALVWRENTGNTNVLLGFLANSSVSLNLSAYGGPNYSIQGGNATGKSNFGFKLNGVTYTLPTTGGSLNGNAASIDIALLNSYLDAGPRVISPNPANFVLSTANQDPGDFSLANFGASDILLASIGLVNPPTGASFSFGTSAGLTRSTGYNSWTGLTRISFTGTQANINTALASLSVATGTGAGDIKISVSATVNEPGNFYNPINGHFYKPVSWPNSGRSGGASVYPQILADAAALTFKGSPGYLVTITSATEDSFVSTNTTAQNVLIGLSDKDQEGVYKWDSGPEAGTVIRNGSTNVSGKYNNWASGEPNNWGSGENYVVTNWNGGTTWNDFGPPATQFPGSISSYIVEFGTWTDPDDNAFLDFYSASTTYVANCPSAQAPAAPVVVTEGTTTGAGTVRLVVSVPAGVTVDWYASATGGSVLPGGQGVTTFTTPVISSTTTFYAQSRNISAGCLNVARTAVIATIAPCSLPTVEFKLSAPNVSISAIQGQAGTRTESFNSFTDGNVPTSGTYAIGNFTKTGSATTTKYFTNEFYGAPLPNSTTLSRYLGVFSGNVVNVTLTEPSKYLGFWWAGGDDENQVTIFGVCGGNEIQLAQFTTSTVTALLSGTVTAVDGNAYNGTEYRRSSAGNSPFAYVNLQLDNPNISFTRLEFTQRSGGGGFEVDNITTGTGYGAATATTPAAPTITSISAGETSLTVNFTAPTSNGGSSITNYEYSLDGGTTWVTLSPVTTTSPFTINGLTVGLTYDVKIRAVNSIGSGTASNLVSTTTQDPTCSSYVTTDFQVNGGTTLSNNIYTLTKNQNNQNGSVWNKNRLYLDQDFDIKTKVYLGNSDSGADGIAFVLQNQSLSAGSSGGGLGYAGISPSFAVEFDTYDNGSVDPTQDHIALIANGNTGANHNTYSTAYEVSMEDGQWHTARFVWDASTKNFQVWYDGVRRHNITIDLKADIFNGRAYVYWGMTGATGGATNLQQVEFESYCYVQQVSATALAGTNNTAASLSFCTGSTVNLQSSSTTNNQWYKDGLAISGATSRELEVSESGAYTVVSTSASQIETTSEVATVTVTPLPSFTYSTTYSFERTKAITPVSPTSTGGVISSYSVSPNLPAGLTLNSSTGRITGTPTTVSTSSTYTVTGTSASSCTSTTTFSLEVFNAVAPSSLSYSPSTQTVRIGTAITVMTPSSSGGAVDLYTISPSLPSGLSINPTTGIISGTLTQAQTGSIKYTISATNTGGTTTAEITLVFNTAPTDLALSPASINENNATNAVIGNLSSTDIDAGDTHTYTLVSGTGSTDNALFTLDSANLKTTVAFDFETKNSYSIRVRTTDAGGLSFEKSITVTVNDLNEAPTNMALSASAVNENVAANTAIGTLSSTDEDASNTFTYTLVSGTGSTDNAAFNISGNNLRITASPDFEVKSSYSVRVRTSDQGGLSFEKAFTVTVVDLNEAPTDIAVSVAVIYEKNAIGAVIGNLSSTDQDAGDKHTYSLVSGDVAAFRISGNQLQANVVYTHATKNIYDIVVKSTDAGGLTVNKAIRITILQSPVLVGSANLPRNNQSSATGQNVTISKGYSANLNLSGSNIVKYVWSPSTGLSATNISNPIANPTQTTTYTVTVTNAQGVSTNVYITVTVLEDYNITPNNVLSPDGDGVNDFWTIENLSAYPNNEVKIFDKAGRVIYSVRNYQNNWNGQLNGEILHEGAYYYVINLGPGIRPKIGYITLFSNK